MQSVMQAVVEFGLEAITNVTTGSGLSREGTWLARRASSSRSPCCHSHSPSSRLSRLPRRTFSSTASAQIGAMEQLPEPRDAFFFIAAEPVDEAAKVGLDLLGRAQFAGQFFAHVRQLAKVRRQ